MKTEYIINCPEYINGGIVYQPCIFTTSHYESKTDDVRIGQVDLNPSTTLLDTMSMLQRVTNEQNRA